MTHDEVTVRGNASAEEVAVVLALLARVPSAPARLEGYARWRQGRLAAIRTVRG